MKTYEKILLVEGPNKRETISKVREYGEGKYEIGTELGCFLAESPNYEPKKGDTVELIYLNGPFTPIRGIVFHENGKIPHIVKYQTEEEYQAEVKREREKEEEEKRLEWETNGRKDFIERFNRLPDYFQKRLYRFFKNNSDFGPEYLPYELMCCEQAIVISNALQRKAIPADQFKELKYEEQKEIVPDLDEGHSGNSFGFSFLMARLIMEGKTEVVEEIHGALAPLVGSEKYGCVPTDKARELDFDNLNEW